MLHLVYTTALQSAENWTFRKADQKYLGGFEMWCRRRMKKSRWTDHMRNEEVLHGAKEERNTVPTRKRRKVSWVVHILRRNCLLKHAIQGKISGMIKVTGRRRRRREHLLYELTENREYWKLRKEAADHTLKNSLWCRLWKCRKTRLRNG